MNLSTTSANLRSVFCLICYASCEEKILRNKRSASWQAQMIFFCNDTTVEMTFTLCAVKPRAINQWNQGTFWCFELHDCSSHKMWWSSKHATNINRLQSMTSWLICRQISSKNRRMNHVKHQHMNMCFKFRRDVFWFNLSYIQQCSCVPAPNLDGYDFWWKQVSTNHLKCPVWFYFARSAS